MKRTASRAPEARPSSTTLEQGHIYFFYGPRVDRPSVRGLADLRRFYVVLHPHRRRTYRLILIGEKRLPAVSPRSDRKSWAFIDKVGRSPDEVEDELDPATYDTRTRGRRQVYPARPAGEGVYALVRHGDHTHLAYTLEFPRRPGPVQRALKIVPEGSYIVSIKNPEAPSPPSLGLDDSRRARLPKPLRDRFQGRRFISVDPPKFLDYEGVELLFIGAARDASEELGLKLARDHEAESDAAIFRDLHVERSLHPVTPLFEGTWA